jgi:transposase-like protein
VSGDIEDYEEEDTVNDDEWSLGGFEEEPELKREEKLKEVAVVALGDIFVTAENMGRIKVDPKVISQYATIYRNDPETMPPIKVMEKDEGLVLIDGFHRYEAMKKARVSFAKVEIYEEMRTPYVVFLAAQSNMSHGKPLSKKDVRERLFKSYIKAGLHKKGRSAFKSYRDIARDLKLVEYTTIRNWMKQDFPSIYKALQKDTEEVSYRTPEGRSLEERIMEVTEQHLKEIIVASMPASKRTKGKIRKQLKAALEELGSNPKVKLMPIIPEHECPF